MFKRNEGILDRIVRVALGTLLLPVGLLLLGGLQGNVLGLLTAVLGGFVLITGLTGVCILYIPFGISTFEKEKEIIARCKSMADGCHSSGNSSACQMCRPGPQSSGKPGNQ